LKHSEYTIFNRYLTCGLRLPAAFKARRDPKRETGTVFVKQSEYATFFAITGHVRSLQSASLERADVPVRGGNGILKLVFFSILSLLLA